jgi:hypothetical protein
MRLTPLLLLVASCGALEPDYVELSPYAQRGDHSFSRPVSSFDEDTYGLSFTVGWHLGAQARAYRNLEALDVSKGGELLTRTAAASGPAVDLELNVDQASSQEAESSAEASPAIDLPDAVPAPAPQEEEETEVPAPEAAITPPKDPWEGLAFLLWGIGLIPLAGALVILHKAGLRVPFLRPRRETGPDPLVE